MFLINQLVKLIALGSTLVDGFHA